MTRRIACTLLAALVVAAAGRARAEAPTIELVTMGPGDDAFSRFGHAALCVSRGARAARCFNYGTTDFSTPGPLTWAFLRGRARFWLSTVPRPVMLEAYAADERTVYSQVLPLDERAARELARLACRDPAAAIQLLAKHEQLTVNDVLAESEGRERTWVRRFELEAEDLAALDAASALVRSLVGTHLSAGQALGELCRLFRGGRRGESRIRTVYRRCPRRPLCGPWMSLSGDRDPPRRRLGAGA